MSQPGRIDRRRDRFFVGFGRVGIRYPAVVGTIVGVLFIVGALFAAKLTVTTSRTSFVDEDNWYQSRLYSFYDEFGHQDAPIVIISGGTVEQRRATVDGIEAALEADEIFAGRVLARTEAEDVAETLMVHAAGQLADFRKQLPPGADLPGAMEQGLEGIFGLLEQQMFAALDGEVELDLAGADERVAQIAGLAKALDDQIAADAGAGPPVEGEALLEALAGKDAKSTFAPDDLGDRGLDDEGYFVSNDGERLLVVTFPEFASDRVEEYRPAVDRLRAITGEFETDGIDIMLTGLPLLATDEQEILSSGMARASFAAGLGIFVILILAFRFSVRRAAVLMGLGIDFPSPPPRSLRRGPPARAQPAGGFVLGPVEGRTRSRDRRPHDRAGLLDHRHDRVHLLRQHGGHHGDRHRHRAADRVLALAGRARPR